MIQYLSKNEKGSWGFGLNKFPTDNRRVIPTNDSISFYQYVVLNPGKYSIKMSIISDKKVQWEDSINATVDGDVIGHLVNVPIKDINRRDLILKVVVNQNNNTSSKVISIQDKEYYDF